MEGEKTGVNGWASADAGARVDGGANAGEGGGSGDGEADYGLIEMHAHPDFVRHIAREALEGRSW